MKTIEGNNTSWVIADYDQEGDTAMVISWCGTTKFDWFAIQHDNEDGILTENSEITHVSVADLADPRFEPLDVIILHVVKPAWKNVGHLTPKNTPEIAFACIRHNFDDPTKTEMAIFTTVIHPRFIRTNAIFKQSNVLDDIFNGGYIFTPGTSFFDEDDLRKIARKFRTRFNKALK